MFNSRIIRKSVFLIGQVPIQKYGLETLFSLFNIKKIEKVLLKCFPHTPPPRDQANPFAYCCSFTFHTSYRNVMIGHGGGGGGTMSKCSKTTYYKNELGSYFVQTCR